MTQPVQMIDDRLHRRIVVMIDHAEARIVEIAQCRQDDRNVAVEERLRQPGPERDTGDDDPVDAAADQRPAGFRLGGGRAFGVGGQHRITQVVRGLLDAHDEFGVERIAQVGHHDPDRPARARLERACDGIRLVAGVGDGALDLLARGLGDQRRAADHVGDRRLGDTGPPGDIDQRGHGPSSRASARRRPASERSVPSGPS